MLVFIPELCQIIFLLFFSFVCFVYFEEVVKLFLMIVFILCGVIVFGLFYMAYKFFNVMYRDWLNPPHQQVLVPNFQHHLKYTIPRA